MSHESLVYQAALHLKQGKIIAFPTDTVYGLGVSLHIEQAENLLYALKQRSRNKPLVIYVNSLDEIERLTYLPLPSQALQLAKAFLPGPLTLLVPHKNPRFSQPFLGFRILSLPIVQNLITLSGPILGTSANLSDYPPAITSDEVVYDFPNSEIFVIPGQCIYGLESTVLSIDPIQIYREGMISQQEIESVLGLRVPKVNTPSQKHPFSNSLHIHTFQNEKALYDFLDQHPSFHGVISLSPTPQTFYPTLRKALQSQDHTVLFVFDRNTSLHPSLTPYLLPYMYGETDL